MLLGRVRCDDMDCLDSEKMGDFTLICRASDGLPLVETWEDRLSLDSIPGSDLDVDAKWRQNQKTVKLHARLICRKLPSTPGKCTVSEGDLNYHYIVEDGICYMTATSNSYPKRLAFLYLANICEAFSQELGKDRNTLHANVGSVVEAIERPYHYINFERKIRKLREGFIDPGKALESVNNDISQVSTIMRRNINELLHRGENIQDIGRMAEGLLAQTEKFRHSSKLLGKKSLLERWPLAIGALGIFTLLVVYWRFIK